MLQVCWKVLIGLHTSPEKELFKFHVLAQKTSSTGKARLQSFRENKHLQKEGLILSIMWWQTPSDCEATAVIVMAKKHKRYKNKSYEMSPLLPQQCWHSQCTVQSKRCCSYLSCPKDIVGSSSEKYVTATAMSSHTHENKHTRGVFQKLLWDGELKYTLPIQLPEFCCLTGTLHSCSKGDACPPTAPAMPQSQATKP